MKIARIIDVEPRVRTLAYRYFKEGRLDKYETSDGYVAFDLEQLNEIPMKKRGRKIKNAKRISE